MHTRFTNGCIDSACYTCRPGNPGNPVNRVLVGRWFCTGTDQSDLVLHRYCDRCVDHTKGENVTDCLSNVHKWLHPANPSVGVLWHVLDVRFHHITRCGNIVVGFVYWPSNRRDAMTHHDVIMQVNPIPNATKLFEHLPFAVGRHCGNDAQTTDAAGPIAMLTLTGVLIALAVWAETAEYFRNNPTDAMGKVRVTWVIGAYMPWARCGSTRAWVEWWHCLVDGLNDGTA